MGRTCIGLFGEIMQNENCVYFVFKCSPLTCNNKQLNYLCLNFVLYHSNKNLLVTLNIGIECHAKEEHWGRKDPCNVMLIIHVC